MNEMSRKDPVIRLSDLHLTLPSSAGPVSILRGIDLDVAPGSTIGIVGPSGSGKSTLLMVLAGLERPSQGSVFIDGQDLGCLNEDQLAVFRRDMIGIVFQSFHLIPTMTALENVAVPLELARVANARGRAEEGLEAVGLSHRMTHYPAQLSGGEQQRVALARAIAVRPKVLLADEPTGNLDGKTGTQIIDLLFNVQGTFETTLFLITHDEALAQKCDRIVRLRDGKVATAPEPAEMHGQEVLAP